MNLSIENIASLVFALVSAVFVAVIGWVFNRRANRLIAEARREIGELDARHQQFRAEIAAERAAKLSYESDYLNVLQHNQLYGAIFLALKEMKVPSGTLLIDAKLRTGWGIKVDDIESRLHLLERLGYVEAFDVPGGGRLYQLTEQGHAVVENTDSPEPLSQRLPAVLQ